MMLKDDQSRAMRLNRGRNSRQYGDLVTFHINLDHVWRTRRSQQHRKIDEFRRLPLTQLGYMRHAKIALDAHYAAGSNSITDCGLKHSRAGHTKLADVLPQ